MSQESKPRRRGNEGRVRYSRWGAGKILERYREGTNVVLLEPDVAAVFRNAQSVNRALRLLIDLARKQVDDPSPGS